MGDSEDYVRRKLELAENVRRACVEAAIDGYERAAMSGLCREGAWEAGISAMRMVDLAALLIRERRSSATLTHPVSEAWNSTSQSDSKRTGKPSWSR